MKNWQLNSWRTKATSQQANYPSSADLEAVLEQLTCLPSLVTPWEITTLNHQLAEACAGKRFILQGGDCAETFSDCQADIITNKLRILLQMSVVLIQGLHLPIIRVGRIAGQYAKPRSNDLETQNGLTLPS